MLELDNLAFDYGLTVSSKEKIQDNWEVVLEGFQTRLLNAQRRWHVSSMTLGIPLVIIMSAKFVESSIYRQLLTFGLMVGIVAVGEIIELACKPSPPKPPRGLHRRAAHPRRASTHAACSA